jgi:hypothetical protein
MNRSILCCTLVLSVALAACRRSEPEAPPVATPTVSLKHQRVPAGSVMDITYKFVVAADASFDGDFRVFVHFLDADGEYLWGDDHQPAVPTSTWKPGQTIEYTRTIFAPVVPYVGETSVAIGLHGTGNRTDQRLPLAGEHLGQRAYKVARFDLVPQAESLATVFKDGWHQAESQPEALVEWQWTKQEATIAFRNPRKDALCYLDLDSMGSPFESQQVTATVGGQVVDTFTVTPKERTLRKIALPAAQMGPAETVDLRLAVDKTFVPAQMDRGKDQRTLGVRVFHVFVDSR